MAQLIGVGTLLGFVFTLSYVANLAIHAIVGQRVSAADELEGLDIPEMGALCYPEFVLKPDTSHSGAAAEPISKLACRLHGRPHNDQRFPINGELGGHSLTWQCPPTLDFPREALECFQEGVERLQTG